MIKTNIKMRVTPEQLRRVQEICFGNGIEWADTGDNYIKHNMFVGVYLEHKTLWGVLSIAMLNDVEYKEIDADLFIKTNGTCEEKYKTEYFAKYVNHTNKDIMPKDYDDALKKISNLRIALNKKVEKNKNQALEINKLLEQKKDLQDKLNQANRVVKVGIDNIAELVSSFDKLNDTIDLLANRVKEKDTIISYLESKLK